MVLCNMAGVQSGASADYEFDTAVFQRNRLLCVEFTNFSHVLMPVACQKILARQKNRFNRRCTSTLKSPPSFKADSKTS